MRVAVGKEGCKILRQVACRSVTHLDRCRLIGFPLGQNRGEIFPGKLASGEEQGDLVVITHGHDTGGEEPLPIRIRLRDDLLDLQDFGRRLTFRSLIFGVGLLFGQQILEHLFGFLSLRTKQQGAQSRN